MPSLHLQAKEVFSVPYGYIIYWNSEIARRRGMVTSPLIADGRLDNGPANAFEIEAVDVLQDSHFVLDPLCGPGTKHTEAAGGDLEMSVTGRVAAPGWWMDFTVWMQNEPGLFEVRTGIQRDQIDVVGLATWPGTIPTRYTSTEIILAPNVEAVMGHVWMTGNTVAWRLNNLGSGPAHWMVEMKAKAGV